MEPQRILSIKDLNLYIRMKLDSDRLLSDVWIRGEISNFTHHSSGHMYFTLKDEGSRIRAIMFASHNQRLPFKPKEGAKVIARGNVTVYERDGQYQFYATHMQPDGIGSLYLAFEQLKKSSKKKGCLPRNAKGRFPNSRRRSASSLRRRARPYGISSLRSDGDIPKRRWCSIRCSCRGKERPHRSFAPSAA